MSTVLTQEGKNALNFWIAHEFLNFTAVPKDVKIIDLISHQQLPWEQTQKEIPFGYRIYACNICGNRTTDALKTLLNPDYEQGPLRFEKQAVTSLVLHVNKEGYLTNYNQQKSTQESPIEKLDVFTSTLLWGIKIIEAEVGKNNRTFDFSGFYWASKADIGLEAKIKERLFAFCKEHKLVPQPRTDCVKLEAEHILIMEEIFYSMIKYTPKFSMPFAVEYLEDSDDTTIMNSLYATELMRLEKEANGKWLTSKAMITYLNQSPKKLRIDVETREGLESLIRMLAPQKHPLACWPSDFPLNVAQQFAVNTIAHEATDSCIFSVNGPPGTGKTTMLKDVIAHVIQQRADKLMQLDYALQGFGTKIETDKDDLTGYQLNLSLRGFGIAVSSANNGAVENISKELPSTKSDKIELDYFQGVANSLSGVRSRKRACGNWGLVSAALGNKSNIDQFRKVFWDAEDEGPDGLIGLRAQIKTTPNPYTFEEAKERYKSARLCVVSLQNEMAELVLVIEELNHWEFIIKNSEANINALNLKKSEVSNQCAALQSSVVGSICELTSIEDRIKALSQLNNAKSLAATKLAELNKIEAPTQNLEDLECQLNLHQDAKDEAKRNLSVLTSTKPDFFENLFSLWCAKKQWRTSILLANKLLHETEKFVQSSQTDFQKAKRYAELKQSFVVAQGVVNNLTNSMLGIDGWIYSDLETQRQQRNEQLTSQQNRLKKLRGGIKQIELDLKKYERSIKENEKKIADTPEQVKILANKPEWNLWISSKDRQEFHKLSPYKVQPSGTVVKEGRCLAKMFFDAQRQLFVAAMDLHKAFIYETWQYLEPTLNLLFEVVADSSLRFKLKKDLQSLWDTLFLVVPVISTTFASFHNLFRLTGQSWIGYVLVDEAGQAAPALATSASYFAKRLVVVGDPLQLDPVVSVPSDLSDELIRYTKVDRKYAPSTASVQTLADNVNVFGRYTKDPHNPIWLGSPLVVHRRCTDPMFSIANAIAYDNMMVFGQNGKGDLCAPVNPSQWINLPSGSKATDNDNLIDTEDTGHWIQEQGELALDLVHNLTLGVILKNNKHQVYVISPFKVVANQMNKLLKEKYGRKAQGMCGTVHTFQGKEAPYVIFLLCGKPGKQTVVNAFAGKKPNLVNVAVTRAKERLYVIGDRSYWAGNRYYGKLACLLDSNQNACPVITYKTQREEVA